MLAAVRQVGEDARKLAQMLITPEGVASPSITAHSTGRQWSEATPATPDVRCLIVSLDLGRLVMNRSKMRRALVQAVPSEQQFLNPLPIPAPLLNLVEVAPVGIERVVGFFVGPVEVGHP